MFPEIQDGWDDKDKIIAKCRMFQFLYTANGNEWNKVKEGTAMAQCVLQLRHLNQADGWQHM